MSANIDKRKDSAALQLEKFMKELAPQATMFGHQDDMAYGIGWVGLEDDSDIKRLTGSYPAIFGWDVGKIGNTANIDNVHFESIRKFIIKAHGLGGINTISWHAFLPTEDSSPWTVAEKVVTDILPGGKNHAALVRQLDLIGDFINSLADSSGQKTPIIFRPWHEMDGSWFWWGKDHCTIEEYKELFRFTIEYLVGQKNVTNMLVGYSPDRNFLNEEEYLRYYPGDDIVDLIGFDDYWDFGPGEVDLSIPVRRLEILVGLAQKKDKIAALTETGLDRVTEADWFTAKLDKALSANEVTRQISYVLVWRNFDAQFFAPYPGHPAAADFCAWAGKNDIWLLEDLQKYRAEH